MSDRSGGPTGAARVRLPEAAPDSASGSGAHVVTRVTRGAGALSVGAAVNLVGQLSIVPVALHAWGKTGYGEWVLLTGLVTLLKVTDLGLQTFVVNRMTACHARGEHDAVQRALHSALRVQYPLIGGVLAVTAGVLVVAPLDRVLNLRTIGGVELIALAILLAMELLIGVPMGVITGLYRATGRLARAAMIGAGQQVAFVGLTLGLIAGGGTFLQLAAARVVLALLASVVVVRDLRRLNPWLRLWPTTGTLREGAGMIGPGLLFLLIPVADYLSGQLTLVVVQKALDPGEVSRLATHRTVVNLAVMASGLLSSAVWPELTMLHARGEDHRLVRLHRSLAKFNLWVVGAVALGMLPFIPLIYPAWTAGRLTLDGWTVVFLIVRALVWGTWSASMTALMAINRHRPVVLALLGAAGVTTLLAVALVPLMGIRGVALAALLGDLAVAAWLVPSVLCREIQDSLGGFWGETALALAWGIAAPAAIGLAAWFSLPSAPLRYALVVPACVAVALGLMWRQLSSGERRIVRSLSTRLACMPLRTSAEG